MTTPSEEHRYRMVNVRPGYVIVEQEMFSRAARSYFAAESVPPKEEYWEGKKSWSHSGMAQSFQFDVLDGENGETIAFRELLGLLYWGCAKQDSILHRIGELAQENRISIYVAITYENPDGTPSQLGPDKVRILNQLFNERVRTPDKKILILPDLFDLYRSMSYGEIMLDFGLTSMEG